MPTKDDCTPFCAFCGAQIELMVDCVVMLSGQFFWMEEDRYAPLVLETDAHFEAVDFADAGTARPQKAIVLDPLSLGSLIVVHRECLSDRVEAHDEDCDDDDGEALPRDE